MVKQIAALLTIAALPNLASADSPGGPLEKMAEAVPIAATGEIFLADVSAAKRQLAAFPVDDGYANLLLFAPLATPPGFDPQGLAFHPDGYRAAMGFSIAEIGQIAGWGKPPDTPVIMTFPGIGDRLTAIGSAFRARGYQVKDVDGADIWHRLDDNAFDNALILDDAFSGPLGQSVRLAVGADRLLFSRTWASMKTLRTPGPSLRDDPIAARLLAGAYALDGYGDLLDITLLGPQMPRNDILPILLGASASAEALEALRLELELPKDGLPWFPQHALALWQDGARMTGAILIPFADRPTADKAQKIFERNLATVKSLLANRPFDAMLPKDRKFHVIESGGGALLVLAFANEMTIDGPITVLNLISHPRRMLMDMHLYRELSLLVGG